ncbi:Dynamin-binding protein [Hypsibius exemplaris]|uniref:Dynamin-binding protein n=1 Tax=Hypsibius exemplaris TaxID=2072580 RepID=A0A1W0W9V2_HYPEX|nr:Dynamin-binding protein [Hypsibius exemplaris]
MTTTTPAEGEEYYARAVTDFWSEEKEELSCSVNDIIRVYGKDGRKLLRGENLFTSKRGLLPTYCVQPVEIPAAAKEKAIFFAREDFAGTETGDLSFSKGALIIGEKALDGSWWSGWIGRNRGIFPLQWTIQVPSESSSFASGIEHNSNAVISFDFRSPIPGELSVRMGETVKVLGKRSDGWYTVESGNGDRGSVPDYCLDLEEASTDAGQISLPVSDGFSSDQATAVAPIASDVCDISDESRPHGRALYDFDSGIAGELKLTFGDVIYLVRKVDDNWMEGELLDGRAGMFPVAFIEILSGLPETPTTDTAGENPIEDASPLLEDFPPNTYAIVVHAHVAGTAEQLPLQEGDTVTILSKRGVSWIEAMDDYGNVGLCPTHCLEIIGSEPDEVRTASQMDDLSVSSYDSFKRSDGSVSPTLSGELTAASLENSKRSSWHNEHLGSSSPTAGNLNRGRHASLQYRPAKRIVNSDDRRLADLQKREKIVREIIETEDDFLHGLKVCLSVMRSGSAPPRDFNIGPALPHLEEVLKCSDRLLHDLKAAEVNDGQIGECFVRHMARIRSAYITYCQNSDCTIESLAKYKDIPELSDYMDEKVGAIRHAGVNCFDLAGMLIKPLQRLLKYPLLMSELLKVTGSSHSDHVFVADSLKHVTEIASSINELKRRKELVIKYRSLGSSASFTERWSDRLSRMSLHSISKKTSRLSLLVSSGLGFTTLIQDPTFQTEERKFQVSKRTIKWFIRTVSDFIEQAKVVENLLVTLANDHIALTTTTTTTASTPPDSSAAASPFVKAHTAMSCHMRDEFVPKIDLHVIQPLEQVLRQYQGPSNLISKRHAKLMDFENAKRRVEKMKHELRTQAMLDELELAKKVYQALNAQLLEDLPKFNDVICRILQSRIDAFLHFRKNYLTVCASEMAACSPSPSATDSCRVLSQKLRAALTDMRKLDFGANLTLPVYVQPPPDVASSSSTESLRKVSAPSPPTEATVKVSGVMRTGSVRVPLSSPIPVLSTPPPPGVRYRVVQEYRPVQAMDLVAHRGDIVEVIKKRDPMGSDVKWFIRRNGEQGFLPKEILTPDVPSGVSPSADRPPPLPMRVREAAVPTAVKKDVHVVGFDFTPGGPYQLPLTRGDEISVLNKHDLDGNSEWWYVEDRHGNCGYAPSAYLKKFA